jgi:hypothetical protein
VLGACAGAAIYRTSFFADVGLFDEDFFLLAEDTDMNIFVREGAVVLEPGVSRWDRLVERVRAEAASVAEADVDEEMRRLRPHYGDPSTEVRHGSSR